MTAHRGHLDSLDTSLHGWVVEAARPHALLDLALRVDGTEAARGRTGLARPDVAAAGLGGPACGFALALPAASLDGAEHDLTLHLADGTPLALPGLPSRMALGPVRFQLQPAAKVAPDAVLALLRQTRDEGGPHAGAVSPARVTAWLAAAAAGRSALVFAAANGRLVGYAEVLIACAMPGHGLLRMSVLAAYRRRGIGRALLAWAEAATRRPMDSSLWLTVAPGNHPARALYRQRGFALVPDVPLPGWRNPGDLAKRKRLA